MCRGPAHQERAAEDCMTAVYGVTQFEFDEENDIKNYGVWFCDITHGTPPWKPLYILHSWLWPGYRGIQRAYEQLSVPTSRGWDIRSEEHTSELQSLRHLVCRL